MKILLPPKEAAAYLTEKGVKRSPNTLNKQRTLGGGPQFLKLGAQVFYTPELLDRWLEKRLSEPFASTSAYPDDQAA